MTGNWKTQMIQFRKQNLWSEDQGNKHFSKKNEIYSKTINDYDTFLAAHSTRTIQSLKIRHKTSKRLTREETAKN